MQVKQNYDTIKKQLKNWTQIVAKYQVPSKRKAIWQMLNTIVPFLALWVLMYYSLNWSYFITLALALINGLLLIRVFIIQHDCGHHSFLRNNKVNDVIGFCLSFLSSIPYKFWASTHAFHHGHNGQLEHTNVGDIKTISVEDFQQLSPWKKFRYRTFRNPLVLFILGPIYYLGFSCRLPVIPYKGWKKFALNLTINNVLIAAFYISLGFLLGWKKFLMVQLPIFAVFGVVALWFFYVQHQHEEAYKQWSDRWDYLISAIKGSTYYKLPKLFQWFSGNIGFHHIHHLNPNIPNYNLEKCAKENPVFQKYVTTINFKESLKCLSHHLWDEKRQKMISFWEYRKKYRRLA